MATRENIVMVSISAFFHDVPGWILSNVLVPPVSPSRRSAI
jgi:hypothetical protein